MAAVRTPLETVIDALTTRGKQPRGNGQEWTALCPAHNDSTPSLSIGTGNDGRALLHCHTGCPLDRILDALDLTDKDLFTGPSSNGSDISATYDYVDETGTLLFQVVRKVGKQFVQRRPDGNGGWIWKLGDTRRVLYRLPEVIKGITNGETIFVVEGEKDADRLAAEKITATCNPHGAGKWRPEYNATLKDANVVIVADSDPTGRAHAVDVAHQLDGIAATIQTVEGAAGKDVSDHLAAGYTVEQLVLVDLESSAPERAPTSWAPVDLTDALAGIDIPPPTICPRTDGLCLIYEGRVHWFQGESESCKSWAAQIIVADELKAGHDVLYIDLEDDERGVIARLRSLGVTPQQINKHLIYLRPDEALQTRNGQYTDAWIDFIAALEAHTYQLSVLDGVTEAMTIENLNLGDNTDVAAWMRLLPKRIAALGAAVICIDHVVKDREGQGRYAIGGQHKLAGVTGAAYRFTTIQPLARATTEPVEGTVAITVMKDRPGYIRGRAPEGKIGTLTITADPDGGVRTSLDPPGQRDIVDMTIVGRILTYLDRYDGQSKNKLENEVEGGTDRIRHALGWLTDDSREWIRIEHKGRSHLHYLTDVGRSKVPDK